MAKLTLNTIGSRYGSIDALNDNFNAIEGAIENTFSLDGTSPNALLADLDMNSQDILNAGEVSAETLRINGVLVEPTTGLTAGAAFQTYEYTATAGQTSFSVAPATPYNASIVVIVNGLQLSPTEVSVSSTNVLTPAMTLGDEVVIRRYTAEPVGFPDASEITYLPSGTGATPVTVQNKFKESVSVFDFFPSINEVAAVQAGTSTLDSTPYLLLAANYAAPKDIDVIIPGGTLLLKSTLALTSAHNNLTFRLQGATLKKAFNGTLVTVTSTSNFSVDGVGTFNGDGATYTGKGFFFSGAATHQPYFGPGIVTTGFADNHFYFAADAGFQAKIMCHMTAYSGQSSNQAVLVNGPDTQALMRYFGGVIIGHITLTGALGTYIHCPIINRVETDADTDVLIVSGTSWSNNDLAMTLNAGAMIVTGCRFSGSVTLSSSMSGSFVGNMQTSGTFTNNSIPGNALVHHHEPSATFNKLGRHSYSASLTQSEFQLNQITSLADSNSTWSPDNTSTTVRLVANLTANRTITLSTTNARAGMIVRISRPGASTGGPWSLTVNPIGTTLATKTWCDAMYNGSYWEIVAYGSLP